MTITSAPCSIRLTPRDCNCSRRERKGGKAEYFHTLLSATLVAPGHNRVVPLPPEFVAPQDGSEKQDCESRAARRWLKAHGAHFASLNPVYLGDDLYSRQPICEDVLASGGHFLFVCKPASHKTLYEWLDSVEVTQRVVALKRGKARVTHTYRWMEGVPLRDGDDAMTVNWLEIAIADAKGNGTYRNSFITDLPVNADNVVDLAAAGRARWKIENETFNVLKTKGYNLEHNFGHGKENLAAVLGAICSRSSPIRSCLRRSRHGLPDRSPRPRPAATDPDIPNRRSGCRL